MAAIQNIWDWTGTRLEDTSSQPTQTLTLMPLWITFCTWCGLSGALRSQTLLSSLRIASTGCFPWEGVVESIIPQEVLDKEAKIGLHWSFLGKDLGSSEVIMFWWLRFLLYECKYMCMYSLVRKHPWNISHQTYHSYKWLLLMLLNIILQAV